MKVVQWHPEIIKVLKNELAQKTSRPLLVGVAGGSATGKTSAVAYSLLEELGTEGTLLNQDSFQKGKSFVESLGSMYKWDDLRNFDLPRCKEALLELRSGNNAEIPNFSLHTVEREGTKIVKSAPIVVFEGLYALHDSVRDLLDVAMYVEAPFFARLLRRIFRFTHELGIPKPETALRQCVAGVFLAHEAFVSPQREGADLVIQMPYTFEETRKKFSLKPVTVDIDGMIISKVDIPGEARIEVRQQGQNYLFLTFDRETPVYAASIEEQYLERLTPEVLRTF